MAPKLKQSSLHSFLLSTSPNPDGCATITRPIPASAQAPPTSSSVSPADAADYERARQDNIRRNRDFLQKLGIPAGPLAPKPHFPPPLPPAGRCPKRRRSLPSRPPSSPLPLRRSTRNRSLPAPSPDGDEEDAGEATETPSPAYVDSSVFQYACEATPGDLPTLPPPPSSSPISGFRVTGKALRNPSLPKIYTVDVLRVKEERVLVSAGGHGGFISIFGADLVEEGSRDAHPEREIEGPLLSWKGSRSWVSGVLFVEENPMLLVSSSNDGGVVIWDVSKQPSLASASSSRAPPVVAESKGLHSGGIFSMHRRGCSVATASKDSSVGISTLKVDGQLVVERTISGHHQGVIRGICFGETQFVLADCGADGRICILDARLPEPCTLTITSNHLSHINTVEWCPSDNFLLLSASKDPILRLHDIRNSREPVHELQGHVPSNARICNQIYRPTFVGYGTMVATPGPGSKKISMYSVGSGKLTSQGMIGYDANLVFFTEHNAQASLWTAGKQINQLTALRSGTPS